MLSALLWLALEQVAEAGLSEAASRFADSSFEPLQVQEVAAVVI